jgi:hypothetical protein
LSSDPSQVKFGRMALRPGQAIEISDSIDTPYSINKDADYRSRVGKTIKAYLTATKELLDGRLQDLREAAPRHMTTACRPVAFIFPEGIIVRYDLYENPDLQVFSGIPIQLSKDDGTDIEISLWTATPFVSEQFLHCVANPIGYDPGPDTPKITISVGSPDSVEKHDIVTQRIFAVTQIPPEPSGDLPTVLRPVPTISIRNEFDIVVHFETEQQPTRPSQTFLIRNRFRIPAGWEALELFPRYPIEVWNPDTAALWAENDLLAAVLQRNLRDNQFKALDPMAEARKLMARILSECEKLLDGKEEPLHQYIKAHPELLSPTHYRMWSKLSLGKRDTDFVFREPSGDYLLVELESPLRPLFRADGQQREELTHAIDQIVDWRRYIEDNLRTVQQELGLDGISTNPACLIVIGRSSSLNDESRRKLVALQNSMPKIRIMTYDDLIANAKAAAENILGPLWDPGPNAEVYLLS